MFNTALLMDGGDEAAAECTHLHSQGIPGSTPASPWSTTGIPFGDAAADRHIIVAHTGMHAWNTPVSAVTIGGVAATLLGRCSSSVLGDVSMWIAAVPTGTSGTITITMPTPPLYSGYDVFRATGLQSAVPVSTYAVGNGSSTAAAIPFGTMTSTAGGFVLAVVGGWVNVASSYSWSGTMGVVESTDWETNGANDLRMSCAVLVPTTGASGTVTATSSNVFIGGRRGGFAVEMR